MARQVVVPLLLLFAMTGLALAKHATPAVPATPPTSSAPSGGDGGIGDGTPSGDDVEPAPVGGPVPPGAFSPGSEAPAPKGNGANCLKNIGVTGALVATAVAGFFSF